MSRKRRKLPKKLRASSETKKQPKRQRKSDLVGFKSSHIDSQGFYHYYPVYDWYIANCRQYDVEIAPREEFYVKGANMGRRAGDPGSTAQALIELKWLDCGRPYYRAWPKLVPYLAKFSESKIRAEQIKLPRESFGIYFHKSDRTIMNDNLPLRSLLFGTIEVDPNDTSLIHGQKPSRAIVYVADFGERDNGLPLISWLTCPLLHGRSIDDCLKFAVDRNINDSFPVEVAYPIFRICLSICFLAEGGDDSVLSPVELRQAKYVMIGGKQVMEKPAKYAKQAFDVGKEFTVQPHWRSPSPLAKYWVGKGRKTLVLRYRRGCVVKRKKVKVEYDEPSPKK